MSHDRASEDAAEVERILGDLARLRLDPHRVSLGYRFGLVVVAVTMVLLPLAYFALVGLYGWWVAGRLVDPPSPERAWAWVGYLLLCVAGPVSVLFLVKPWFSRRGRSGEAQLLQPGEAPDLECFVGLLARAVGAPGPREIEFDCSANASAGFRGGWRGMWRQELKLTFGLPLVAGLDIRSFAGVLAHELGHFSQRAGMRLAWLVMAVNQLFGRLVLERDGWDQRLQEAARSERAHVQLFGIATLLMVWLARQPLWALMWFGQAISSFALRQMEFDADGYEIVFAGSDAFRYTSREIKLLNVGTAKALQLVGETLPEGRLPRNLPMLARTQTEGLSPRVRQAVEEEMMSRPQRMGGSWARSSDPGQTPIFFPTHPSDRERIEVAESYDAPGLLHSGLAARSLFDDFDGTAERVTAHFYGTQFDLDLSGCELVGRGAFAGAVALREERFSACEQFFEGHLTLARPLVFTEGEIARMLGRRGRAGRSDLDENARAMRGWLKGGSETFEQFEVVEEQMLKLARASELFQAGFRIRPKAFGLPRSLGALSDRKRVLATRRERIEVRLAEFDRIARRRIAGAVALHISDRSRFDRRARLQTRRVLRALGAVGSLFPELSRLRLRVLGQGAILQNLRPTTLSRSVVDRLQHNSAELADICRTCRRALARVPYPFEHAAGRISVATYVDARFLGLGAIMSSYKRSEVMLERLYDLYFRLLGHLCATASAVEEEGA